MVGEDSCNNVDAIANVDCPCCKVTKGKLCVGRGSEETILVHKSRLLKFFHWSKLTNFVPNHLIGEPEVNHVRKCS